MSGTHFNQNCTCVYCGGSFSPKEVRWRISDKAESSVLIFGEKVHTFLKKALDHFCREDTVGWNFFSLISGRSPSEKPKRIRLVMPDDFASSINKTCNHTVRIFKHPKPDDPILHFSKDFVERLNNLATPVPRNMIREIEDEEIYPVCPFCTAGLPRMMLSQKEPFRLVKLGFAGPINSGKTTLNVINILFGCLDSGGWKASVKNPHTISHYLLPDNYYKTVLNNGTLPSQTPDRYIPPLLLWLERDGQYVLLSLLDIPGKRLQAIRKDILSDNPSPQTECYIKLFKQMDGWLLMLDAEQEILRTLYPGQYGEAVRDREPLLSLLKIFSQIQGRPHTPGALVISKCDRLFLDELKGKKSQELFASFTPLELRLWQQSQNDWLKFRDLEDQPKLWREIGRSEVHPQEKRFYVPNRHEIVQYSFKPFIEDHFPELAKDLKCHFSRVDVFPVSSLGSVLTEPDIQHKLLNDKWVKPFYSAEPIFWLLDIIK